MFIQMTLIMLMIAEIYWLIREKIKKKLFGKILYKVNHNIKKLVKKTQNIEK